MANRVGEQVLYPELSYRIMQAAFEVHNHLGPGFSEDIYERALIRELQAGGISTEQQKPIDVYYKGMLVGNYRLDVVVEGKIILELKAVTALNDLFRQQLLSYLKATGLRLGILINFGGKRIASERVVHLTADSSHSPVRVIRDKTHPT